MDMLIIEMRCSLCGSALTPAHLFPLTQSLGEWQQVKEAGDRDNNAATKRVQTNL